MQGFWHGRRVLVTGHTGFKGVWLTLWLQRLGAEVHGLALPPGSSPSLYELVSPWDADRFHFLDIRNAEAVRKAVDAANPEIVFHLAAQALVRSAYREPVEAIATNVLGTAHVLDAIRHTASVQAAVIVTTDKVYENPETGHPFVETDRLGGKDPYSNSKACSELVTQCFIDSYFKPAKRPAVATARAGNVVGGGDWSTDRLIPDVVRAWSAGEKVSVRYPQAVRPWQHVLEPVAGYMTLARKLIERPQEAPTAVNFGPDPDNFLTVADVLGLIDTAIQGRGWEQAPGQHPPEAASLTLDSSLAATSLAWKPRLTKQETFTWTANWYRDYSGGASARDLVLQQIEHYEARLV